MRARRGAVPEQERVSPPIGNWAPARSARRESRWAAWKRLIKGVIAAGSYKKFVCLPLQELLNLLSLAQRGKLATTDPVMKSLVGVDNHVVWNVLTYWAES